ncbi:ABC transporter permease [Sphaerisporangium siamense]|uniref:Peptide/nickel transport system permease protein n=1 Tax=Sphaerisporangium siamense TaxID=795645 RepID=A0A7W7GBG6_9ACTN|nr:ABC transporter permease [Sphaerisporangium siamense]MBB4700976.1 peptide/nickel transport system permease protein [Sphaerisporangium siamense]GII85878.1 ABC transporter permease [Sphaerisporangium siamense]
MLRFAARRALAGIAVLWAAASLAFAALHLLPGDVADAVLGPNSGAPPQVRAQIRQDYGLDDPLPAQYLRHMAALATGDLGRSYQFGLPVSQVLADQVGPTVELAVSSAVVSVALAFCAALATGGRGGAAGAIANGIGLLALSVPSYWLGILGLAVFSFRFGLLPAAGADGPQALVLPALTLALPLAGVLAQVIRQQLHAVRDAPFVLTARARGAGERRLLARHTLRHAALPVVTLSGWITGALMGGAVLTETVFARPGLGRVLVTAVGSRDIPVVSALMLVSAAAFVVVNLLVDLAYLAIDPRLRAPGAVT